VTLHLSALHCRSMAHSVLWVLVAVPWHGSAGGMPRDCSRGHGCVGAARRAPAPLPAFFSSSSVSRSPYSRRLPQKQAGVRRWVLTAGVA